MIQGFCPIPQNCFLQHKWALDDVGSGVVNHDDNRKGELEAQRVEELEVVGGHQLAVLGVLENLVLWQTIPQS